MFDPGQFHNPEFRTLVLAARAVIAERVHRGGATPPERLAGAALDEMPDEDDPAAVRAWAPSAAFRDAVRSALPVAGGGFPPRLAWFDSTGLGTAAGLLGPHSAKSHPPQSCQPLYE